MKTSWITTWDDEKAQEKKVNDFCSDPERIVRFTQTHMAAIPFTTNTQTEHIAFLAVIYYDTISDIKARKTQ